jgi:hypothetical protein
MDGLEDRVRVDRVIAVLHNNLSSPGGEPRELRLELMDPDFVKSHQLFVCFRITYTERQPAVRTISGMFPRLPAALICADTFSS